MVSKFMVLDAFLAPRLLRPFYLIGLALALLWGLVGLMFGLALSVQMPLLGMLIIVFALVSALLLALAVRLVAESVIATLRMHARFVGGGPNDPIPE